MLPSSDGLWLERLSPLGAINLLNQLCLFMGLLKPSVKAKKWVGGLIQRAQTRGGTLPHSLLNFPAGSCDGDLLSVAQFEGAFPLPFAGEFFDVPKIDDGTAADAEKIFGGQPLFEFIEGFPQNLIVRASVNDGVVVGGLNPRN